MSEYGGRLGVAMLRKLFPTDDMPALLRGREAIEWLDRAYWINIVVLLIYIPGMLVCGVGISWLLIRTAGWLHGLRQPAIVEATAPWLLYAIPGFFLGIVVGGFFVSLPIRLWLGAEGYRKYEWAASCIAEYDGRRATKWVFGVMLPPLFLFLVLGFDWQFRITSAAVERNDFWGLGTATRPLVEVDHAYLVREEDRVNGKYVERSYLVFDFPDGERWTTQGWSEWPHVNAGEWARRLREDLQLEVRLVSNADGLPPAGDDDDAGGA